MCLSHFDIQYSLTLLDGFTVHIILNCDYCAPLLLITISSNIKYTALNNKSKRTTRVLHYRIFFFFFSKLSFHRLNFYYAMKLGVNKKKHTHIKEMHTYLSFSVDLKFPLPVKRLKKKNVFRRQKVIVCQYQDSQDNFIIDHDTKSQASAYLLFKHNLKSMYAF